MHLPDGFLTIPVSISLDAIAAAGIGIASRAARRRLEPERLPLLGTLGGFVFAAQMLNFPIAPGVSGHLTGGALLAIVLGPAPAVLAMSAVVIVQCLLFADGGLLALGANLVNLALVAPLVAYGVHRLLRGQFVGLAAFAGVVAAASTVSLELTLAGTLPPSAFLLPMLGLHAIIGVVEALATRAAVAALKKSRPGILGAGLEAS